MSTVSDSFLGTGWGFPPEFDPWSGPRMASDEQDVHESLQILLSTQLGERVLEPRYGCDLMPYAFEPMTNSMAAYVRDLVERAIVVYEPRVLLHKVDLRTEPEGGRLLIDLTYTIPATNTRHNLVFPYYLREGGGAP